MTSNDSKTASMLQRLPRILEVTAHSYGLSLHGGSRRTGAAGDRQDRKRRENAHEGKPAAQR